MRYCVHPRRHRRTPWGPRVTLLLFQEWDAVSPALCFVLLEHCHGSCVVSGLTRFLDRVVINFLLLPFRCHSFLICSTADRYVAHFQFKAIANSATVSVFVSVFGCAFLTGVGLLSQGINSALAAYLCCCHNKLQEI